MALRLAKAFRTTPELWLNLQRNYDLWHAAHDSKAWQRARIIMSQSHQTVAAFASEVPEWGGMGVLTSA